eukprot:s1062_g7.t1
MALCKVLLATLLQLASCIGEPELQQWLYNTEGLDLSKSDSESVAHKEAPILTACGVSLDDLKQLRSVLYSTSYLDFSKQELKDQLLDLSKQHIDPETRWDPRTKVEETLKHIYTNLYSTSSVDLPKAVAKSTSLELMKAYAQPDQVKELYGVLYSTTGVNLPKKDAQVKAVELAKAGADPVALKNSYASAHGTKEFGMHLLQISAIKKAGRVASLAMLEFFLNLPAAWACSYVEIPWQDHGHPSTMELANVFNSTMYTVDAVPRSVENKFGYIAPMSIFHLPPTGLPVKVAFEGMNEAGLTISAHAFAQSVYEKAEPGTTGLNAVDIVPALLANCSTADAAIELLESVRVVAPTLPGSSPEGHGLHWAIADSSGRSIIVEYIQAWVEETEKGSESQISVAANGESQDFDGFVSFVLEVLLENNSESKAVRRSTDYLLRYGIPGDSSPPRTALLNNVFIPFGSVAADPRSPGDGPELTDYGVLKSLTCGLRVSSSFVQERVMLIRGYRNSQWRKIDLKRVDFSQANSWLLEDGTLGIKDVTCSAGTCKPSEPGHVPIQDGKAYNADGFQQYYGANYLKEWGDAPTDKRIAPDSKAYSASQFRMYFQGSWESKWEAAPVATQIRLAKDSPNMSGFPVLLQGHLAERVGGGPGADLQGVQGGDFPCLKGMEKERISHGGAVCLAPR